MICILKLCTFLFVLELWFLSNFLWFCDNIDKKYLRIIIIFLFCCLFHPKTDRLSLIFVCLLLFYVLLFCCI